MRYLCYPFGDKAWVVCMYMYVKYTHGPYQSLIVMEEIKLLTTDQQICHDIQCRFRHRVEISALPICRSTLVIIRQRDPSWVIRSKWKLAVDKARDFRLYNNLGERKVLTWAYRNSQNKNSKMEFLANVIWACKIIFQGFTGMRKSFVLWRSQVRSQYYENNYLRT
jgi:hypothetical protein